MLPNITYYYFTTHPSADRRPTSHARTHASTSMAPRRTLLASLASLAVMASKAVLVAASVSATPGSAAPKIEWAVTGAPEPTKDLCGFEPAPVNVSDYALVYYATPEVCAWMWIRIRGGWLTGWLITQGWVGGVNVAER
jgi:hypothetical protein